MKVIYGTDFHGNEILFQKLLDKAKSEKLDAIIYGGDIGPRSALGLAHSQQIQLDFLMKLIEMIKPYKIDFYIQMGNDDLRVNYDILERAEENQIIKLLNKKRHKLGKYNIIGYSYVPVTPFRLKDWEKYDDHTKTIAKFSVPIDRGIRTTSAIEEIDNIEQDLQELRKLSDPKKTIYVMHSPPFETNLDVIFSGAHVGSKAIKRFIENHKPYLTLHGHIHEAPKISGKYVEKIDATISVNPGSGFINFAKSYTNKIVTFDTGNLETLKIQDL